MRITIPGEIKAQIDHGRLFIAHESRGRWEYGLAVIYPDYFKGTDYPGQNKDGYYCWHCQGMLSFDQVIPMLSPDAGNSQEPYTEEHQGADARLGATYAVMFRNLVSSFNTFGNPNAWLEALFTLKNGYERRLASEAEWDEFELHMHELVRDTLDREHDERLAAMEATL